MNARDALRKGTAALSGSGTPFLDASLILAAALGIDRGRLLAAGSEALPGPAIERYRAGLERRASGESVAYILGYKEFWGRRFAVDERVLVPRPDTELLVRTALDAGDALESGLGRPPRLHDAFCGSGCVAISVAADRPAWRISASDISGAALEVASANASALLPADRPGGALELGRGDLLDGIDGSFDLVLANPPYVGSAQTRELAAKGWREPVLALDGGLDGLDVFRRFIPEAASRIALGGWLLVEADGEQAAELRGLFERCGFDAVEALPDLAGIPRVTRGRRAAGAGSVNRADPGAADRGGTRP